MTTLSSFAKQWSVYSKTSDHPCVALRHGKIYVFVSGLPMTYSSYIALISKALLPNQIRLTKSQWLRLHQEAKDLCADLALDLSEGREAIKVLQILYGILGGDKLTPNEAVVKFNTINDQVDIQLEKLLRDQSSEEAASITI